MSENCDFRPEGEGTSPREGEENPPVNAGEDALGTLESAERAPDGRIRATNSEFIQMKKNLGDVASRETGRRTPRPDISRRPRTGRKKRQ